MGFFNINGATQHTDDLSDLGYNLFNHFDPSEYVHRTDFINRYMHLLFEIDMEEDCAEVAELCNIYSKYMIDTKA